MFPRQSSDHSVESEHENRPHIVGSVFCIVANLVATTDSERAPHGGARSDVASVLRVGCQEAGTAGFDGGSEVLEAATLGVPERQRYLGERCDIVISVDGGRGRE